MALRFPALTATVLSICWVCRGQTGSTYSVPPLPPETAPAAAPATMPAASTASAPATTTAEAVAKEALAILKNLEAAGPKYPNIIADLDYREDLIEQGDVQQYTGKVYYQAGDKDQPGRFRIHFDTVRQGLGPSASTVKNPEDFVFDGLWFIVAKERIKKQWHYQVARPGEKIEALQLGKGPFPVPFGQKAETVLKFYTVSTRPAKDADPPGADYIKLLARPEHRRTLDARWLEMWVERKTGLPVKIVGEDRSGNRKTVLFKNTTTPAKHAPDTFTLPKRDGAWEIRVEKLPEQQDP